MFVMYPNVVFFEYFNELPPFLYICYCLIPTNISNMGIKAITLSCTYNAVLKFAK